MKLQHIGVFVIVSAICTNLCLAQEGVRPPLFQSQSDLVLVSFNVIRGSSFVPDLTAPEIELMEDGRRRQFTVFESPAMSGRSVELILLFDTTRLPPARHGTPAYTHWNPDSTYDFVSHWNDSMSRSILQKNGEDIRVSVYRFDDSRLQRICRSAQTPQELLSAFQRLMAPMPDESTQLVLPAGRKVFPVERSVGGSKSWPYEAAIATLNDSARAQTGALRMLAVFSEGIGRTTTVPEDVRSVATTLGISVFPVILDYDAYARTPIMATSGDEKRRTPVPGEAHPTPDGPPSPVRYLGLTPEMEAFGLLGEMTGGRAFTPSRMDAGVVRDVLGAIRNEGLSRYVVGFSPQRRAGLPKAHNVEVRLVSKSVGKVIGGKSTPVY